jgi:hypothetical protein
MTNYWIKYRFGCAALILAGDKNKGSMRFLIIVIMLSSTRAAERFKEIFCRASWEVNTKG